MSAEPPFVPFTTASLIGKYTTDNLPSLTFAPGSSLSGDLKYGGIGRVTAETDFVSSATVANITGASLALTALGVYAFTGIFPTTSGASGGVKVQLDTSDTLTLTDLSLNAKFFTSSSIVESTTTSFQSALGSTTATQLLEIDGSLTVNAAGTLTVKGAQNASNSTTTGFLKGGYLQVTRIS